MNLGKSINNEIESSVWDSVLRKSWVSVRESVSDSVKNSVHDSLITSLMSSVRIHIDSIIIN